MSYYFAFYSVEIMRKTTMHFQPALSIDKLSSDVHIKSISINFHLITVNKCQYVSIAWLGVRTLFMNINLNGWAIEILAEHLLMH